MPYPTFLEEEKLWRKGFDLVIGVDEVGRGSWAGPVVAAAVAWPSIGALRSPLAIFSASDSLRDGILDFSQSSSSLAREALKNRAAPRATFESHILNIGINDSKALSSQKRIKLADIIKECSLWSVGEVGVGIINRLGIGKATEMAMRKALRRFVPSFDRTQDKQGKPIEKSDLGRIPRRGRTSLGKVFVLVDAFHIRYLRGVGLKNQKAIIKGDQKSISIAAASIIAKVYRDKLMRSLSKKYPRYGWGRSKGYGTKEHQEAILKYGMTRLHRKAFVGTFLRKKQIRQARQDSDLEERFWRPS